MRIYQEPERLSSDVAREPLLAAEIAEVAVLIDRQGAGEDRVRMTFLIERHPVQHLWRPHFEEFVVATQHVELLAAVSVGGSDEHRTRGRQHRVAERFDDRAERRQLPALNAEVHQSAAEPE